MDAAVQAAWVADLRSGQYEQTPGTLHNQDGYCCLGVGAAGAFGFTENIMYDTIMGEDGIEEETVDFRAWYLVDASTRVQVDAFVPEVCDAIGLDKSVHDFLTKLNDTHRWSFEEIADFIDGRDLTKPISQVEEATIINARGAANPNA